MNVYIFSIYKNLLQPPHPEHLAARKPAMKEDEKTCAGVWVVSLSVEDIQ
jgi:hypothetical protein